MTGDQIADEIRAYLGSKRGIRAEELPNDQPLFTSGLLDSLDIVLLVGFVESKFQVPINPLDVSIESFDSIDAIVRFVAARGAGGSAA